MNKKLYILIFSLVVVLAIGFCVNLKYSSGGANNQITPTLEPSPLITDQPANIVFSPTALPTTEPQIPNSYLIENFPFQSQAPFANWDQLHDEACEEASLILTYYYINGKSINANEMEDQIQKMVQWEIENWSEHKDLTIKETSNLVKSFYGLSNFEIKNNITIDDIKKEVSAGHPVIVPTAGRLLGNPNFRSPGPVYHMVVVIGFSGNTMIVQDVGTRNGNHYQYNEKIFYNAIHDWAGSADNIETGQKTMLIFQKN
ncbi:MAG: C39 family peptidase [Patescibacteria group bacterium]|nr:C39 family peptidase [Patescibacteria group bacterium]